MVLDSLASSGRVQLLEVYARSVTLLYLGRPKDWAHLFLPDAVLECSGSEAQQFKGREELLALGRRMMLGEFDIALGIAPPPRRHVLSNISLFHDGQSQALGFTTLAVIGIGSEAPRWLVLDGSVARNSELPEQSHPRTASGTGAA